MNYIVRVVGPAGYARYLRITEVGNVNDATSIPVEIDAADLADWYRGALVDRQRVIVDVVPAECE